MDAGMDDDVRRDGGSVALLLDLGRDGGSFILLFDLGR